MVDKKKIISILDSDLDGVLRQHNDHKQRVIKAIDWFNENAIDKQREYIIGSKVNINGVTATCVEYDFRGAPAFNCQLIFIPYNSSDDCGSGAGMLHEVEF